MGFDPHIATGRQKHHEPQSKPVVEGERTGDLRAKKKMQQKLQTPTGQILYAFRKHIVELVFGQMKDVVGIRKFLLRGVAKVRAEWQLICLTHKVLRVLRRARPSVMPS